MRPDILTGASIPGPRIVDEWFNSQASAAPPFGQSGDSSVNVNQGPGYKSRNMAWLKNFRITERGNEPFRAETFNT